jgi:hypothetical protein
MPLYVYEAAYTPESVAAQIQDPHDRFEAVRPAFETRMTTMKGSSPAVPRLLLRSGRAA